MAILIKNRVGQSMPVNTNVTYNQKLSADGSLKLELIEDEYNYDVISKVSKMWTITHVNNPDDEREFTIIIVDRTSIGNKQHVSITAREKEIDDLMTSRIYQNITGTLKADQYFKIVFEGTGYKYTLPKGLLSMQFENSGDGETRLELFKRGLERYGLEYEFDAKNQTFNLVVQVNRKADYYISDEVNANEMKIEEDSSNIYTFIKGYGNYSSDQPYTTASLQIEYTHPLAKVIGIREAPPIKNEKITKEDTMKAYLEAELAKSNKVSITLDFVILKNEFKNAVAKIGDIVPIKGTVLNFNNTMRVVEITTTRDCNHNIIKQDVTLGDFKRQDRYIANVNSAANFVGGLGGSIGGNQTLRSVQMKLNGTVSAVKNVVDTTSALVYDGKGIHTNMGDKRLSILNTGELAGLYYSLDKGVNFTPIFDKNLFNPNVVPLATTTRRGAMSDKDKMKLDKLETNDDGLVLTGDDGKKYNLTVVKGQLTLKEAL